MSILICAVAAAAVGVFATAVVFNFSACSKLLKKKTSKKIIVIVVNVLCFKLQ